MTVAANQRAAFPAALTPRKPAAARAAMSAMMTSTSAPHALNHKLKGLPDRHLGNPVHELVQEGNEEQPNLGVHDADQRARTEQRGIGAWRGGRLGPGRAAAQHAHGHIHQVSRSRPLQHRGHRLGGGNQRRKADRCRSEVDKRAGTDTQRGHDAAPRAAARRGGSHEGDVNTWSDVERQAREPKGKQVRGVGQQGVGT